VPCAHHHRIDIPFAAPFHLFTGMASPAEVEELTVSGIATNYMQ
jgi:hypothetical protein